jgi:hypothetical protein
MACETFAPKRFNAEHQAIIEHAIELLEDAREGGFAITLRSLYYQFIGEERWFANTIQSYKRFGDIISKGRLAGLIDWDLIEDRIRSTERISHWASPQSIMETVVDSYKENLWDGQERRVHLRIEKDSLVGVIEPACKRWRIPYTACRGNTSQSEAYAAGKELRRQIDAGLWPLVLYMGDHDPSGIDMTRDNIDRLSMFAETEIEVRRIALNYDQVLEYRLPGNPAKTTDSKSGYRPDGTFRPGSYCDRFGIESWEMEALKPRTVDQILEREIASVIDHDLWNEKATAEAHNLDILSSVLNRWEEVEQMFGGGL